MEEKEIQLRSDVVHEMLSKPPGWTIRWGSTVIILLIIGLISLSAFISYPDIISGQASITTKNPPLRLVSYSSGKIVSILKKENDIVNKGDQIIIIENPTQENHILNLKVYLKKTDSLLSNPDKRTQVPLSDSSFLVGDLQQEFNTLLTSINEYNTLVADNFYNKKVENFQKQVRQYQSLITLNQKQYLLSKRELENAATKFNAQKQLYQQGAIAKMDFLKEEDNYMQSQKQVQEAEKTQVQNQITLTEYEKQLNDITFDRENKTRQIKLSLKQHLNNLQNQLINWQRSYIIQAPQNGKLSFLKPLSTDQYIKQGDELFVIIPDEQSYIARIIVAAGNTGKIKEGQGVNIKLSNYQFTEFGQLTGIVKSISAIPSEKDNYRVEVILPKGLQTSYNKKIDYKPEMSGTAEIITQNLSVLNRIFYPFKNIIKRS